MVTPPASLPTPIRHLTSAASCEHALLRSLHDYVRSAELSSERDPERTRETLRLVALLTNHLSSTGIPSVAGPGVVTLTRREIEVLDAIAEGLSTMEIARALHISVNTARNHVQRILEKLGVHSRLQAVNVAARHGLLQRIAG